jgi:hypothetical protein
MSFELVESSSYFSKGLTVEPSGLSGDSAPADTAKNSSFQEVLSVPGNTAVPSLPKDANLKEELNEDGSNMSFSKEPDLYTESGAGDGFQSGDETDGGRQRKLESKARAIERQNKEKKETTDYSNVLLDYGVIEPNLGRSDK